MLSEPGLRIFASGRTTDDGNSNFPLFPLLPKEIRLCIWQYSLQRQRIIKVYLESHAQQIVTQREQRAQSTSKSKCYCAIVDGYQVLSKLLRVNGESREVALRFYRVHLTCRFRERGTERGTTRPGTFYFNPEYDSLHISPAQKLPVKDTLVDFLYHLKMTLDPLHVGLLNLAMHSDNLKATDLRLLKPTDLDSRVQRAFVETLTQLQEVFFVCKHPGGRQILGCLSGIPTSETILNHAFPIMATAPTFDRLHRDPRPISQDLRKVFVGTFDPRDIFQFWQQLLKKWGISSPQTQYRFLLAFIPSHHGNDHIYDLGSAERWLQNEDNEWRHMTGDSLAESSQNPDQEHGNLPFPFYKSYKDENIEFPVEVPCESFLEEGLRKGVQPAFGFWLFPLDAFGALREEGVPEEEGFRHKPKQLLDMNEPLA